MAVERQVYLQYSPELEQPAADEAVVFDELSRVMQHITRTMASRYRHAYRPVHAKSHGLLLGTMDVLPGLPDVKAMSPGSAPAWEKRRKSGEASGLPPS